MATAAHKRTFLVALLIAVALGEVGARASETAPQPAGVAGRVRGGQSIPLAAAGVYAHQLPGTTLAKVSTDPQGRFLFSSLPAGVYHIIVHKAGFAPAILLLTRTTAEAYQFLEFDLARETQPAAGAAGKDFWSVRARIPADVLRDIERSEGAIRVASLLADPTIRPQALASQSQAFRTDIEAMTGFDQAAAGGRQMAGGRLGIEGRLGQTQVDLETRFWQLDGPGGLGAPGASPAGGQTSAVRLGLARGGGSRVDVAGVNNRQVTRQQGVDQPVGYEQYRLSWSQTVGENGRSELTAQYTEESNYHRQAAFDPAEIPEGSRTWRVEGSYTAALGPGSMLQTGIRYRERQFDLGSPQEMRAYAGAGQSNLDLFGRGGVRVQPSVLLEYGLYSTLSDGSLAMTPRGGVVLQLGERWQLAGSVARRVYEDQSRTEQDFLPTLYGEADLCEEGGESCYELRLTRSFGDEDEDESGMTLGAVHRTVGKTLRLYFSDDFFNRLESLYLVPGDELPEVRMSVNRRLSPNLLATLESRVASGGGGMFHTADGLSYENRVRYLVTSLDTRYQRTATGVFLAIHRLDQQLDPLGPQSRAPRSEVERLQLLLTQDLNILFDLAAEWSVQLNMELSRGGVSPLPTADDDELRRRILGGFAVRF